MRESGITLVRPVAGKPNRSQVAGRSTALVANNFTAHKKLLKLVNTHRGKCRILTYAVEDADLMFRSLTWVGICSFPNVPMFLRC